MILLKKAIRFVRSTGTLEQSQPGRDQPARRFRGFRSRAFLPFLAVLALWLTTGAPPSIRAAELVSPTRPAAVAGQFYPDNPDELKRTVAALMEQAQPPASCPVDARVAVLVVPHAGYVYSGPTAATGFKALQGLAFDRVYFLGVDHHSGHPTISVWGTGAFDTPLGPVPAAATFSRELLQTGSGIVDDPSQHLQEHSLEVLLPFFLHVFGNREATFISVGGPPENGLSLGDRLYTIVSNSPDRFLFIISTDWSHYHDAGQAEKLDRTGLDAVLALNEEQLLADCHSGNTELCGLNGVLAATRLMRRLKGNARLLERTDSSRSSGDTRQVVGYAAILMTASPPLPSSRGGQGIASAIGSGTSIASGTLASATPAEPLVSAGISSSATLPQESPMTTATQTFHQEALRAVRTTLEGYLKDRQVPVVTLASPRFKEVCGVFVTLKKHGELRGCIGLIQGIKPLGEGIQEMAIAAATEDPRFPTVTTAELADIDIEISVLTPMTPVKDLSEIQVGRDGLLLRRGFHSGLLLPQVPTEYGWDRDTFLEHLCYKAGLPKGSHRGSDAQLLRFSAEVFGEKE